MTGDKLAQALVQKLSWEEIESLLDILDGNETIDSLSASLEEEYREKHPDEAKVYFGEEDDDEYLDDDDEE